MTDTNNETSKISQELIQHIFEKTSTKVTPNDPAIETMTALVAMLDRKYEDFESMLMAITHNYTEKMRVELDSAIAGIEAQLDGANMYYVGNSENHERNLSEAFKKAIEAFDEKNKDLNFILNKIQADYDKASDERFERQIEKLQALHQEQLKHQSKQDTKKQREVLFAVAGFVAGLVVCLLVLFIVK